MFKPCKSGMALHVRRSVAIRYLPGDGALIHVVGGDPSVRRLDQAQTRNSRSTIRGGNRAERRELGRSPTNDKRTAEDPDSRVAGRRQGWDVAR